MNLKIQRNNQWKAVSLNFFTIDQNVLNHACHIKRAAVNNDNIGVLSLFKGTDTVSDANVFGRIDGYGAERVILVHAALIARPAQSGR